MVLVAAASVVLGVVGWILALIMSAFAA